MFPHTSKKSLIDFGIQITKIKTRQIEREHEERRRVGGMQVYIGKPLVSISLFEYLVDTYTPAFIHRFRSPLHSQFQCQSNTSHSITHHQRVAHAKTHQSPSPLPIRVQNVPRNPKPLSQTPRTSKSKPGYHHENHKPSQDHQSTSETHLNHAISIPQGHSPTAQN